MSASPVRVGVILNGVTGRMGTNQHLLRSILPIVADGGVATASGARVVPIPVLVGRDETKLRSLAAEHGVAKWTTNLDEALSDPANAVYFDAQATPLRAAAVRKALAAGKDVYCEKPSGVTTGEAYELFRLAAEAGVVHGVVQDKLWLPGILKLRSLIDQGFFGRIVSARGEFGYWVFEGDRTPGQRPSWNYRKRDGGGIILDMFPHWRYLLDHLLGRVRTVTCRAATHIRERWDERGKKYDCDAEDAAYAVFQLEGGAVATIDASWATRVRRDDLLTFQVNGTGGSAVAGLRDCRHQSLQATPRPVWNPDLPNPIDFMKDWLPVADQGPYPNAFRKQWELFLVHVADRRAFPWDLLEGAKGVQLAEKAYESWETGRTVEVVDLQEVELRQPPLQS